MANTFSCLNIHCVFSTKERVPVLNPDIRERLWPYIGGIAKQNGMISRRVFSHLQETRRTFRRKIPLELAAPITPCPTGRLVWGALSQALRARLRSCSPSGTFRNSL